MLPERVLAYLRHGLAATPVVLARVCDNMTVEELDRRPDPARFAIREVLAHLADWEGVWRERMVLMREQDHPFLLSYDEGQWAVDNDYAHADAAEQIARFRAGRAELMAFLDGLSPEEWRRTGRHGEIGVLTIGDMATLVLGHDGYHLRQITEFRKGSV